MITCNNVSLYELKFVQNLDYDGDQSKEEMEVKMGSEYSRNNDEKCHDSRLILYFEVGGESNQYPICCKIAVAGYFDWEGVAEEEAQACVENEGLGILYSFVRTYLFDLLKQANMKPLVLPDFDFSDRRNEGE